MNYYKVNFVMYVMLLCLIVTDMQVLCARTSDSTKHSHRDGSNIGKPAIKETPYRPMVVLITMDGVRSEEVFIGAHPWRRRRSYRDSRKNIMPYIWQNLARSKDTTILGNRFVKTGYSKCAINNPSGRSLPAYANFFSIKPQTKVKKNNYTGLLDHATIFDKLIRQHDHKPNSFSFFASWKPIKQVLSKYPAHGFYTNTGYYKRSFKPPWHNARYDYITWRAVHKYLKRKNKPQFLFVGFNDSDEWGHYRNYRRYLGAIRRQDTYIKRIIYQIESDPLRRGKTIYIISTDHGRGRGRYWKQHSARLRGARSIWAFVHYPRNSGINTKQRDLLIEHLKQNCHHSGIARFILRVLSD